MPYDPKRLEFEGGDWWELETKPTGRQARMIDVIPKPEKVSDIDPSKPAPDDEALAILTVGWSFPEEVTADAVADRRIDHLIDAMEVLVDLVLPFLESTGQKVTRSPSLSALSQAHSRQASETSRSSRRRGGRGKSS